MTRLFALVGFPLALSLLFWSIVLTGSVVLAEIGKPLGSTYDGPEGRPRPVIPAPAELGPDERSTMAARA